MAKVKVHHFKVWDSERGDYVVPPLKSPRERIERDAKGVVIPGTEEEVDAADLDEHGRYNPKAKNDADWS